MRTFPLIIVLSLAWCFSSDVCSQQAGHPSIPVIDATTFESDQTSTASLDSLNEELAVNEGILKYQMGDYQGALQNFAPLQDRNVVAAEYCELCQSKLSSGESSGRSEQAYYDGEAGGIYQDNPPDQAQSALRRWNFTVLTGYQYDSNVAQSPNFVGLGSVADKNDSSWFVASFGDFRLVQEADRNVGLIMSTYDNFLFDKTQFNLQDYMGGAYTNRVLAENIIGGVRYEFHKTLLDRDSFSSEHRLVPNISFLRPGIGHTTFFYEFDSSNFDAQPLIAALDPSANVQAVGVTRARYTFDGLGRIFVGYRFEDVNAEGSDFDRQTHQANARVEVPLTCQLIWDAGGRYFWDDYDNPNSLDFFGNARRDDRVEIRTGLQKIHNLHWSSRLDYTYIHSNSNVANLFDVRFFDYSKHNLTAQVIYDF